MILAILQARVSSSRLPGKVLKQILGRPMLERQIERLRRVTAVDQLVIATSSEASDDPLEKLCGELGVDCFRGSLNNVLDRFYQAALPHQPDHIVRLTGDCPLTDPDVIDKLVAFYLEGKYDYASNTIEPTFPHGLDAEIFSYQALMKAWQEATLPSQKEHVTLFIDSQPELFKIGVYKRSPDLSHLRWTVDEPEDFEFVSKVYEKLYPGNPEFTTEDVLALLQASPELSEINSHIDREAGLKKSLKEDQEFLAGKNKMQQKLRPTRD